MGDRGSRGSLAGCKCPVVSDTQEGGFFPAFLFFFFIIFFTFLFFFASHAFSFYSRCSHPEAEASDQERKVGEAHE